MKFLHILIAFLSFLTCFSQVNPNYHKVKGYYRKDGTHVKSYYRTNRNNTNNDNYTTKPNINPWTGKKGYINSDNKRNYYSSAYHYRLTNYSKISYNVKSRSKTPVSNYYSPSGNAKTRMISKLRNKPNVLGDVIIGIPKGTKIHLLKKENDYWKVQYGSWTGYLNEMYLSPNTTKHTTYKTNNYSSEKLVSHYYPPSGNSKTRMGAKLRNKPDVLGDVIIRIPQGAKIYLVKKEHDYWKVQYGNRTGYLNEMYVN